MITKSNKQFWGKILYIYESVYEINSLVDGLDMWIFLALAKFSYEIHKILKFFKQFIVRTQFNY